MYRNDRSNNRGRQRGNYGNGNGNGGSYGDNGGFQRRQLHYSPNLLSCLNNGIDFHKLLTIEYDSREKGITTREIEPMAMIYKERKRNLVGWCKLRNDWRTFRLDRITTIKVHTASFDPRADFDINNFDGEEPGEEIYEEEEN